MIIIITLNTIEGDLETAGEIEEVCLDMHSRDKVNNHEWT